MKRPRYPMPDFVRDALISNDLMDAYRARPPYQQNDYVGWINNAKKSVTQNKRLTQMLEELVAGDKYMRMSYRAQTPDDA